MHSGIVVYVPIEDQNGRVDMNVQEQGDDGCTKVTESIIGGESGGKKANKCAAWSKPIVTRPRMHIDRRLLIALLCILVLCLVIVILLALLIHNLGKLNYYLSWVNYY